MIEYLEGGTICQVNIHEYQFRHRMRTEPFDSGTDTIQYGHDFYIRFYLIQQ